MDKRREELLKLSLYTEGIDNELTMILQSLQWDRKHLLQSPVMVACKYNSNHRVPPDKEEEHEKECFLRQNGYTKDDQLLPDPLDAESNTLVKLNKEDIEQIIGNASRSDPMFKKGVGCRGPKPLSLERLQSSYSSDERRAVHDAVVSAVPSCHDLADLALPSGGDDQSSKVILSRSEILLELRNMRRRRTKYRVAAKTRNYSDVLRDVIKTQMEHFSDGKSEATVNETVDEHTTQTDTHSDGKHSRQASKDDDRHRCERRSRDFPRPEVQITIKREDSAERDREYPRKGSKRDYRYEEGRRNRDRHIHDERSRENTDVDRIHTHPEQSRKRRHDKEFRKDYDYKRLRETTYEESGDARKSKHSDKDYKSDERSRSNHKHQDVDLEYLVKDEPSYDEDRNQHHQKRSREGRHDKYREKSHKTTEREHDENRRKDGGRYRERSQDQRYEERSGKRPRIIGDNTQESNTREYKSFYEENETRSSRHNSKNKRYDRSYRDRSYDSYSSSKTERHERYYDRPIETVYDPNKKIKKEK